MVSIFRKKREQEWIVKFNAWAEQSRRLRRDYPVGIFSVTNEFNQLEWLTQNYHPDYALDLMVHRDMCDSYMSVCVQSCFWGDLKIATIALERAKYWLKNGTLPFDIPLKLGGLIRDKESTNNELPYEECTHCYKADLCAGLVAKR